MREEDTIPGVGGLRMSYDPIRYAPMSTERGVVLVEIKKNFPSIPKEDYEPSSLKYISAPPNPIQKNIQLIKSLASESGGGYFEAIPKFVGAHTKSLLIKGQKAIGSPLGNPDPYPLPSGEVIETPAQKIAGYGGGVAQYGTYLTPYLGSALLIGSGISAYTTETGKQSIKETETSLKETGFVDEPTAKMVSYAIPALGISFGLLGLKGSKLDPTRPIIIKEKIPVDVKVRVGTGVIGKSQNAFIGMTTAGKPYILETGTPAKYAVDTGVYGEKKILTTPLRQFLNLKPIYSGTVQEQRAVGSVIDKFFETPTPYQKAIKILKERGYTESQARRMLMRKTPQYKEIRGEGEMFTIQMGDENPTSFFVGKEITKYKTGERGGVKFLNRKPAVKTILESSKPFKSGIVVEKDFSNLKILKSGRVVAPSTKKEVDFISFVRREIKPRLADEKFLPRELVTGAGKMTERYGGVIQAQYIKDINYFKNINGLKISPSDPFAVYKTVGITKKIIPEARKMSVGRGIVFIQKSEGPKNIIIDLSVKESKGFMGGGAKSSLQFLKQLYKGSEETKAKALFGLISQKSKKASPPMNKKKVYEEIKPTVQGLRGAAYGFYGISGLAKSLEEEVIIGKGAPKPVINNAAITRIGRGDSGSFYKTTEQPELGKTELSFKTTSYPTRERGNIMVKEKTEQLNKQSSKQLPLEEVSLSKRIIEGIKTTPLEGTDLGTKLKTMTSQVTALKIPIPTPKVPKSPPQRNINMLQRAKNTKKPQPPFVKIKNPPDKQKNKSISNEEFVVFGRRFGIDRQLGQFSTKEEAEKALKEFTLKGLGASGFIEKGGKKIDINLGIGFRPSKVEPKRVVQQRELRLETPMERREIIESKRRKPLKLKWI